MGSTISTAGISPGSIIKSEQILRVINALNGVNGNLIIMSGSLSVTGSAILSSSLSLPFIDDQNILYTSNGLVTGSTIIESVGY